MNDRNLPERISLADNVIHQRLDGESVLLNTDTETYFGLNDVGSDFWTLIDDGSDTNRAVEALLNTYDVEENTLRRDLYELLSALEKAGLVKTVNG